MLVRYRDVQISEEGVEVWPDADGQDLYREHFASLMRIGFCLTGSNEVAEDLVHDTFMRCVGRPAMAEQPGRYLRAALVNACRSYHRRLRLEVGVGRDREAIGDLPPDLVEFRDVLLALSPRQRTAVVLRYLVDLNDAEIAEILGCRQATVRSLVHRGLEHLRKDLS